MGFHKGNTGKVLVKGPPDKDIPVGKWKMKNMTVLTNTTNSGSAGRKGRTPTVKDSEGSFEGPWDDTINAESSGFSDGARVNLELNLGDSGHKWTVTGALIESIEYENDEDEDVTRFVCTWKGATAVAYT